MKILRSAAAVGLFVVTAALVGLVWWVQSEVGGAAPRGDPGQAVVVRVIDGDTVDLEIEGQTDRVRLIGIDTPESVSRDTPVQCFGVEASNALKGLLPPGVPVRIERDAEVRDRFGRLLLYVHRSEDDLFVNEWLVQNGFADTLFFEPNTTYRSSFTGSRNDARDAGIGLWGACEGPDQPIS